MLELQQAALERRATWLVGIAVGCALLSLLLFAFRHDLCRSGFPLTLALFAAPIVGSTAGVVSMFNPRSSRGAFIGKLAVVGINLYQLGMAGISLVGLGIFKCG